MHIDTLKQEWYKKFFPQGVLEKGERGSNDCWYNEVNILLEIK